MTNMHQNQSEQTTGNEQLDEQIFWHLWKREIG